MAKEGLFPQEYFEELLIDHHKEYRKASEQGHGYEASKQMGAVNIFMEKLKRDFGMKEAEVNGLLERAEREYRNERSRQ